MKEADKDVRAPVAPRFANSQSTQPPFLARSPACTSMLTPSPKHDRELLAVRQQFYNPGGRWVTSFRVIRFFPCGKMLFRS